MSLGRVLMAWLVAALVLCLVPSLVVAQAVPEMHRDNVDALDGKGWQPAVSTKGHFAVAMPVVFKDFTIRTKEDDKSRDIELHVIMGTTDDGVRFMVMEYPITERFKKSNVAEFAATLGKESGASVGNLVRTTEGDFDKATFVVRVPGRISYMQAIQTKTALYHLVAEAPYNRAGHLTQLKDQFFASFKVKP
jgi:hypothetical protein